MPVCYLLIIILMTGSTIMLGNSKDIPIIPVPQIVNDIPGDLKIARDIKIIINGDNSDQTIFSAMQIKQTLKQFNDASAYISNNDMPEKNDIVLQLLGKNDDTQSDAILAGKEESYKLFINPDGISIKSFSAKGLFYGAMSLIQLLENSKDNKIPALEITDWPDMKIRGISDDISRGQVPTMENFKRIIRFLARYKMNTYMPYIEDMIKFKCYPSIGNNRGALTNEEVKEWVTYARMYHVEVIPIFETLGHFENILTDRQFSKYAEFPGAASLNVSDDETYDFIEPMIKEICELFPTQYIHIGADESWDVGLGKSKHLVDKYGTARVHLEHYKKVYDIVKKYGKNVLMYGDVILNNPEILKDLPKDIVIVDWQYDPEYYYPSTKVFKESGFTYYVSPSVNNYNTTFPFNIDAVPNIKYLIKSGIENNASGMINSNWGDFGAETLKELCLPGYAWSAQCSWNFKNSNQNKFFSDYYYDFFGINDDFPIRLHEIFNSPFCNIRWNDLWEHPLSPYSEPVWWEPKAEPAERISWLDENLPVMEKYIKLLQQKAVKNRDYIDILQFQADLCSWYKTKLTTHSEVKNKLYGINTDNAELNSLVDENISSLKKLKSEYRSLWLKYNKKENLELIEDKFNRLVNYFEEIKNMLMADKITLPEIPSMWIYYKTNDSAYAVSARFKKEITLTGVPETAYLQLLGDTYARLFINGKYVDEVAARNTLSLAVEYKRIKFIDVSQFLVKGKNTIVVEVKNYDIKGSAGFNLISEIKHADGSIVKLHSDHSWKVQFTDDDPEDEESWKNISVKNYPFYVISPNFGTKRTSWIER